MGRKSLLPAVLHRSSQADRKASYTVYHITGESVVQSELFKPTKTGHHRNHCLENGQDRPSVWNMQHVHDMVKHALARS